MNRRDFMTSAALAGASACLPGWAQTAPDTYRASFHAALASHPWLGAYTGVDRDLAADGITVEGKLPAALRGTLFRNGPALHERGGERYHHLFDGDGMVQAYTFSSAGITHRGRFVRTRKFVAEAEHGKFLFPGFGTSAKANFPVTGPDSVNAANTSVIAHGQRLMALWEGGSAYELDPATLDTRGPVVWRPDLKSVPFSAHPKVEPDGTMWNFGAFAGVMMLYQIAPDGSLVKAAPIKVPHLAMNHDFVVSQNHLIFVLPAMRLNLEKLRGGQSFLDSFDIFKDQPMRVLTVEKGDFSRQRQYELPPGFVFHYGNAWEEASGQIRFDYVRSEAGGDIMTRDMRALMRGDVAAMAGNASRSTQVVIDPSNGTVRQESRSEIVEFPRVDPRRVAQRSRYLFHTANAGNQWSFGFDSVLRHDLESGKTDSYQFPREYSLEEHIVVPRPGSDREGDGWLVGCAYNARTGKTELAVFDALQLSAGPLATARLPYGVPLGFHGHFLPALA